ncbi:MULTISPECIES: acetate--CoA ligase [unclassified Pseudodesulfovibrio]|uniref:acetate--CoA ligase family protein n=1 Tax=unclassified Pseudodesulfovibrio TaxID=2661612 RepID=UPI000FEC0B6E|nr:MULTISPECIES: acetate--CoA ligase [unclassified Pseudodesulfovibrio]MCJ2166304.1 acetate--CoA ligase family protein [Pseudodesulfovibrio sp. S3-i]RWU02252.1 CoA-binding protein [Pseudodesulfovibrio sp. S3]
MQSDAHLRELFNPGSIAVVGASRSPHKLGSVILSNLISAGYKGTIFPVNPNGGEILGLKAYPSAAALPKPPDLGIIVLPREKVLAAMQELATADVDAICVITAGFRETGRDGFQLEMEMADLARRKNITLLGPNTLGLVNTSIGLNATIAQAQPKKGSISFFSQSGALCSAILDWADGEDIGFSKFVSLGNKAGVSEADVMEALGDDPDTKVIIGYLESVDDGQKFLAKARAVTDKKPVIMIKAGTTPAGARATSSHTGSLAGSVVASTAAFKQAGIIRVESLESLFDLARAFAEQPLPTGPNLTVITNSGGPGILAADACEDAGLHLVRPSRDTLKILSQSLPPFASLYNPIDIIGDAKADRYRLTLEAVAKDENTNAILTLLTPTASAEIIETAQAIIDISKECAKPVFACFMGEERIGPGRDMLLKAGIPCYEYPEPAIRAISAMLDHYRWKHRPYPVEICFRRDKGRAERTIEQALKTGLTELPFAEAMDIAAAYELPVPETRLVRTSDQAVRAAKKMGYPVALKIVSPHISSRSEVNGVTLDLHTPRDVRDAWLDITSRTQRKRPDAYIAGCLVQTMGPVKAREVVVRFTQDPQFGPLVSFCMAGPSAEVLGDISYRLAPLTVQDVQDIIREIKSFPLLRGVRGEEPANLSAIEDVLLSMSQMATDFPEIREAELNPILVDGEGALVTDLRLTVGRI